MFSMAAGVIEELSGGVDRQLWQTLAWLRDNNKKNLTAIKDEKSDGVISLNFEDSD